MSGNVVLCSVVCGTLVDVSDYISDHCLCDHQYMSVQYCAFTSPGEHLFGYVGDVLYVV